MIAFAILVVVGVILTLRLFMNRESYITLEEVIPGARIISHEDGTIEYGELQFLLGTHNLKQRKHLIELIDLLQIEGPCIVDLRFDTQIVIRKRPVLKEQNGSGPKND